MFMTRQQFLDETSAKYPEGKGPGPKFLYEGTSADSALHPLRQFVATPVPGRAGPLIREMPLANARPASPAPAADPRPANPPPLRRDEQADHGALNGPNTTAGGMDAGSTGVPAVRPIVLALPYPISANRYWNSFPLGKRIMTAPSPEAKAYKKQVAALAKAQGCTAPILGRVQIDIQLYPKRPQDWKKRMRLNGEAWDDTVRCLDLDNARKVVYDSLKGVAIEDDKWVRRDTGQRMEPDEHGARLIVTITPLAVAQPQGALV